MRVLLNPSGNQNVDLNKLFLEKLPSQVRTILAGSPQPSVELTALPVNDILATIQYNQATNAYSAKQFYNQIFGQRLRKLIDTVEASLNLQKHNNYSPSNKDRESSRLLSTGLSKNIYRPMRNSNMRKTNAV